MSIDWMTVGAQIANFLVLVWLLKRFLYRPILDGIDAREAEITQRMTEAVDAKDGAEAITEEYHEKLQKLHVSQAEMSETIRKSAEDQRDTLLAEARNQMESERAGWQAHMDDEAHKYTARLQLAGADALLSLTRKALNDLADETLEDRIARNLARQLKPMAADLNAAAGDGALAIVVSHSALAQSVQDDLVAELEIMFPQVAVTFEVDEAQSPGIMLRIGGAQLAWTVDSYIDGLAASVDDRLGNGPRV
ncbi:F0F1 ATP synthase subunit B [Yoonia sp. I 8.24]|uniref:F0F1 ATP synthase subunit B family protein n=1 Tax=Yoonia sp. I 8.24 TaxID=1537229 RepID=UPI001EDE04B8|nr:F0F1 ATP synthase subunit B [Yoonia sp. I 8.24]MCG3268547.1 F0F1 ATP synthase subunit B [Yoonia sp. I 8.24]